MKTIQIEMPKNFMNTAINNDNSFSADTNYSNNWDTLKFPLPKGNWVIKNIEGKIVTLIDRTEPIIPEQYWNNLK